MSVTVNEAIEHAGSRLCVGLDPDAAKMPPGAGDNPKTMGDYLCRVVDATADLVCAYKPNLAFFEAMGDEGGAALRTVLAHIPDGILTIADAKRGDIGNTSAKYASALFDDLAFDAATVNPLMGADCVGPFLAHEGRTSFLLCLTSNPGADDFLLPNELYLRIARKATEWNATHGNVGLVVGATRPEPVAEIRAAAPGLPFLIPGLGTQGGEIAAVVDNGRDADGEGLLFNVSRAILYAGADSDDPAAAVRNAATEYRNAINQAYSG